MTLSAADDENVANQRVTDFIGARAEELTFETLGSKVDNDDDNTAVRVSQRQWELRLAGVGCLDGVRVITRDGDETLGNVCRHVMGTVATEGQREEATIFEKTVMGFKALPCKHLIQSLRSEQAHHGLMLATEDVAFQADRAVWDLVDVTAVGRVPSQHTSSPTTPKTRA